MQWTLISGIPLLLVFTAQIGDLMADAFRWLYSRICCRWCRVRRRDNELPPSGKEDLKNLKFQNQSSHLANTPLEMYSSY